MNSMEHRFGWPILDQEGGFPWPKMKRANRLIGKPRSHALPRPALGVKGNADTISLH